ncbi:hypothetical protein [Cohnella zeiphila]|uniref:Uncharacterized protein n=1 Tax=Cohnella zeiphila TaxID=2761120 RepID=A0A7X0SHB3_9BACL|nr:hypothetical protein [Cohnella zeiphila]MBB6729958.1 hypothetical protein [Cohnella zeiphila]
MRKKLWGGILLAAVCLLPLQAVVADDSRYQPTKQTPDTQTVYITDIETKDGHTYVTADPIQWYEGEAANQAFREHEQDPDMTEAPDGYYIVNDVVDPHTYELSPDAVVELQYYNSTGKWSEADINWNERVSEAKFVSLFTPSDKEIMMGFPYHLTVQDGKIVKVVQQYVP